MLSILGLNKEDIIKFILKSSYLYQDNMEKYSAKSFEFFESIGFSNDEFLKVILIFHYYKLNVC